MLESIRQFWNNIGRKKIKVNGNIIFKLQDVIDKAETTKYALHVKTGIRYDTICNYCKGNVTLINVEYLKIFLLVLREYTICMILGKE